jgi:hypothetical protein
MLKMITGSRWLHTCNPSYSEGRDQEDRGSKPAQANSSRDPISKKRKKKPSQKGLVEWLKVKAQYSKNKGEAPVQQK